MTAHEPLRTSSASKVLYPPGAHEAGRELRLLQEYFLVACALRDIVRRYRRRHGTFDRFPARAAIQLNDTQPALAIPELMRQLVDEHGLPWDTAWALTERTFAWTSHARHTDALETWPVWLLERVLPRHAQIIAEINRRFLARVSLRFPGDPSIRHRLSIVDIRQEVGADNIYIFGLTVDDVERLRRDGYDPRAWYQTDPTIARVLDAIHNGRFSPRQPDLFQPLVRHLLDEGDEQMLLADFKSYADA